MHGPLVLNIFVLAGLCPFGLRFGVVAAHDLSLVQQS
jgi:hypothetical protein